METIPPEIYLEEIVKNLSYEDIVGLCLTNTRFKMFCGSNLLWQRLLQRDFWITYQGENARNVYLLYKHALDHFSNYYPIITQYALQALVTFIPISTWSILDKRIRHLNSSLLTTYLLQSLVNYGYKNDVRKIAIGDNEIFDQMIQELEQNCDKFETLASRPTLIFIKRKPIIIKYDYDLACELVSYVATFSACQYKLKNIKDYILSLLE
jgi:hypothetical protein